jgi:transaldolase
MVSLDKLRIKIFADGADYDGIIRMAVHPLIRGFTTNPMLLRKAGVSDYEGFARRVLAAVNDRPISFEVIADDFPGMVREARAIASWGPNVNVKIPVTDTKGEFAGPVIAELAASGIAINVTAVMTLDQVRRIADVLPPKAAAMISVFAGRIADTGRDPAPHMEECVRILAAQPRAELIWASPRELLNVFQADAAGCHIITVGGDLLAKLPLVGKDLAAYSLETVAMFLREAAAAGLIVEPQTGKRRVVA